MPSESQPVRIDFAQMPSVEFGGSLIGRAALAVAIDELKKGAQEIGGKNSGPWVRKYLNGMAVEGASWCAGFVSFCFANNGHPMPFNYTVSARDLLNQFKSKNWSYELGDGIAPEPGDILVWWRNGPENWQGHAGITHCFCDGSLFTIEGNRTTKVAGFAYNLKTMTNLLGFGRVPVAA